MHFEIEPGIGIGPIKLGAYRDEAREALEHLGYSLCASHDGLDYFCNNSIQLKYENDLVRFIRISDHQDIECTYHGLDVFNIEAAKLFIAVAEKEPAIPHEKPGETCYFASQGVNLWEAC